MKQLLLVIGLVVFVYAQKPSSDQVKSFVNYYETGKEAILYHAQLTSEVKEREPVDNITSVGKGWKSLTMDEICCPKRNRRHRL